MKTSPQHLLTSCRAVTCAFAATLGGALFAQTHVDTKTTNATATTTTADGKDNLKHTDRHFIEKAIEGGREEVDIARAVVEHSTNADVKKFAQMMIDDHSKADDQLVSLATARNVKIKEDKDKAGEKWSKKDVKDIDHDYVKKMVSDHKKDIDLFSKESKDGTDSEIVEFARNTLPTLQHHLEEASNLEKTVR